MLTIDRLRLQLPPQLQGRAAEIVRLLGEELAQLPLSKDTRLERLALPAIKVRPEAGAREVAKAIAGAIGNKLAGFSR